jgi:hypothetical protein
VRSTLGEPAGQSLRSATNARKARLARERGRGTQGLARGKPIEMAGPHGGQCRRQLLPLLVRSSYYGSSFHHETNVNRASNATCYRTAIFKREREREREIWSLPHTEVTDTSTVIQYATCIANSSLITAEKMATELCAAAADRRQGAGT